MSEEYPKLRPVEAIAVQGERICLRDPFGISDKLVFLSPDTFFVVSLFDGSNSILDIQAACTRKFGTLYFSDNIRRIVEQLDDALLLDSRRFREARDRMRREYRADPVRRALHAGVSYEQDGKELKAALDGLFEARENPPQDRPAAAPTASAPMGPLRGLIAPHIDIRRGGACFAASYAALPGSCDAKTFVVLGISHAPTVRRFVLTGKDFDTPLGVLPADREFIENLSSRLKTDFFEDELAHRGEHSVEFQAVFLRYVFRDDADVRIVPVLCGSLEQINSSESPSGADPEFREFVSALRDVLALWGNRVCCIAGVDLSHLGRRFGQNLTLSPPVLDQAREEDMRMIRHITALEPELFIRSIQEENDRRNVCGVPAIYTLLQVVDAREGRLLCYDQAADFESHSVVTFMGAALYG
jgi:AmmeMemoRadiSam system protein B